MASNSEKATLVFWSLPRDIRDVISDYAHGPATITRRHVDAGALKITTLDQNDPISLPTALVHNMAISHKFMLDAATVSVRRLELIDHLGVQDFNRLLERFPFIRDTVETVTIQLDLSDGGLVSPLSDAANLCPRLSSLHVIINLHRIYGSLPATVGARIRMDACKDLHVLVEDFKRIKGLQALNIDAVGVSGQNERWARELLDKIEREVVQ